MPGTIGSATTSFATLRLAKSGLRLPKMLSGRHRMDNSAQHFTNAELIRGRPKTEFQKRSDISALCKVGDHKRCRGGLKLPIPRQLKLWGVVKHSCKCHCHAKRCVLCGSATGIKNSAERQIIDALFNLVELVGGGRITRRNRVRERLAP